MYRNVAFSICGQLGLKERNINKFWPIDDPAKAGKEKVVKVWGDTFTAQQLADAMKVHGVIDSKQAVKN